MRCVHDAPSVKNSENFALHFALVSEVRVLTRVRRCVPV
jgi:hypothetical protein